MKVKFVVLNGSRVKMVSYDDVNWINVEVRTAGE